MPELGMTADEVSQLIFTDDLTGLYNRRFLYSYLTRRVGWENPEAPPLSLALIDIDDFKAINDGFGHLKGDLVIRSVATQMRQAFRPEDLLIRYGGDEFCVLMIGVDKEEGVRRCEAMRTRLDTEAPTRKDGTPLPITLSVGVASFPQDAREGEALIEAADRALYSSKHAGKNRTSVAGTSDEAIASERDPFVGLPCPIFVGRESEAKGIRTWLRDLRQRTNRLVLLRGPGGIGKSRLLREITRWARDEGILYLLTRCAEAHMFSAYKSVVALIESTLAHQTDAARDLVRRLSPQEMVALRELVPSLREFPAPEPVAPGEKERRRAAFEGLLGLLYDISDRDPVVLLLDQLEYADRGTLEVLHWLLRPGTSRIMLVATLARDPSPGSPLHEILPALQKETQVETLDIAPLPREVLHRMLDAILPGAEHDPESYDRIVQAAAGNPLYLEEAVRSLLLRGKILPSGKSWKVARLEPTDLPGSLERVINDVFSTIQPEANEILTNAAIIGGNFDLQLLKEVMGQNEGRTQDAVDRVEAVRLILREDPTRPDEYRFVNDRTRQVRYQSTSEDQRREMHLRVGQAEERLQRLDPSELAWQFDRAGDHERAERYREERTKQSGGVFRTEEVRDYLKQLPGAREPRVPEATRPLPPDGLPKAEAFLRHLSGAVRMVRLYPQYSVLSENFGRQLRKAAEDLLAWAPVTFAAHGSNLRINGVDAGALGTDLASLLNDRLISSFTLGSSASWPEIDALARALMEPFDRTAARPNHWDGFLDDKGIRNLDVVQRVYIDEKETGRRIRRSPDAERPLEAEEIPAVRDALRCLKAAADNRRMYPAGHSLVEQTRGDAIQKVRYALEGPGSLTLATAEGALLLNGIPADPRTFTDAGEFFARLIDRLKLGSLTILRGISPEEIGAFVEGLSGSSWEEVFGRCPIQHFRLGDRSYALRAAGIAEEETSATPAEDPVARVKAYLEAPPGELLTDRFRAHFGPLLNAIVISSEHESLSKTFVERLLWLFHHEEPGGRAHAATTLSSSLPSFSEAAKKLLAGIIAIPLSECVSQETDSKAFDAFSGLLPPMIQLLFAHDLFEGVIQILEALRKSPKEGVEAALRKLSSDGTLEPARRMLGEDDSTVAITAARILATAGSDAADEIADTLVRTKSMEHRLAFAETLRALGPPGAAAIAKKIDAAAPQEDCVHALQILDTISPEIPEEEVLRALDHPEPAVPQETFRLLIRAPRPVVEKILRRVLGGSSPEVRLLALSFVSEHRMVEMAGEVLSRLKEETNERLLRAACGYFLAVPTAEALPELGRLIDRRPRWFGLVRGLSEETRVAAARALGAQRTPEAENWIQRALADKDPAVRSAVKLGQKASSAK